jgi:hypothetical protein
LRKALAAAIHQGDAQAVRNLMRSASGADVRSTLDSVLLPAYYTDTGARTACGTRYAFRSS